jgi:hypothetical protein
MLRLSLLVVVLSLSLVPAAQAGEPFTVGEGTDAHLTVAPEGTAHVVWIIDDSSHEETHYCRVPRGATACDAQTTLPTSAFGASPTDTGVPFVLRSAAGKLYIVSQRYVSSDVWLWESADNGATWSAPRKIYSWSNSTDFGEPALTPAGDQITFTVANTQDSVFAAKPDGSEAAATTRADLDVGTASNLNYDLEAVPTADGGMVAVESSLSNGPYFWRMTAGADPSVTASWSAPAQPIGPAQDYAQLAGGSSGQFLIYANADQMLVRKFNGTAFGDPVVASAERGYLNDIAVSGSGAVGAVWRRNGSPAHLRFALSTDAGASFATRTVARQDDVYFDLDVALADDNQGFYVYGKPVTGSPQKVAVGDLTESAEPAPAPSPTPTPAPDPAVFGYPGTTYPGAAATTNASDKDKRISFATPATCVRPGQKFRVRLTWARKKRKGNLFVKVRRSDFYIGSKRVKKDLKAPFTQVLTVTAGAVRGSTITLRARAFIKVKRGKSPTKSIRAKLKVCR